MGDRFEYRTLRIERAAWRRVDAAVRAGVTPFGLWRGEIGWYTDQGALMSAPGQPVPDVLDGVVASTSIALESTVRPVDALPPTADGLYAHRWFEIEAGTLDEFVALSAGAWPDFERAHDGIRVVGLWHKVDVPEHLLLLTRYPSLASWEQSRPYSPTPTPGTDEARARFRRRAEITIRTVVRIGRLVGV